jgi:hypothetical protein
LHYRVLFLHTGVKQKQNIIKKTAAVKIGF